VQRTGGEAAQELLRRHEIPDCRRPGEEGDGGASRWVAGPGRAGKPARSCRAVRSVRRSAGRASRTRSGRRRRSPEEQNVKPSTAASTRKNSLMKSEAPKTRSRRRHVEAQRALPRRAGTAGRRTQGTAGVNGPPVRLDHDAAPEGSCGLRGPVAAHPHRAPCGPLGGAGPLRATLRRPCRQSRTNRRQRPASARRRACGTWPPRPSRAVASHSNAR